MSAIICREKDPSKIPILSMLAPGVGTPTRRQRAVSDHQLARGGRQRTASLSLPPATASPRTPPTSPDGCYRPGTAASDWDEDSVTSAGSCDHATYARNGTTFSGRSMKYVFHCNRNTSIPNDEYLTPTQRVHRQVRKLKHLLDQAKKDLEEKDSEILKLTKEVVELRLCKTALQSPDSSTSDDATVRDNLIKSHNQTMNDSGHYDDVDDHNVQKMRQTTERKHECVGTDGSWMEERARIVEEYERRLQELIRMHEEDTCQLKAKHNDRVEELLERINEINTRYWQLVPELDAAKEKIRELESELEEACKKLAVTEEIKSEEKPEMMMVQPGPSRVSVPELLQELQVTKNELESIKDLEYASSSNSLLSAKEALSLWVLGARKAMYRQLIEARNRNKIDPEITLQFLKSAIYYFLTDKENSAGHLKAIQSILGFTPNEISNIDKARLL